MVGVAVFQLATSSAKNGIPTSRRLIVQGDRRSGRVANCFFRRSLVSGGYKSFRDRRREVVPEKTSSNMWGGVVVSALTIVGGAASAVIMARTEGLETSNSSKFAP